jgi:ribokinase
MSHAITFIGSNCIDEYYELDEVPQLGDKALCRYLDSKIGGMIGNAASVYAGYGNTTYMIDFMNHHTINQILIDDLVKSKINVDYISFDDKYPDSKCLIMLNQGERIIYIMDNTKIVHTLTDDQIKCLSQCKYVYTSLGDMIQIENYKEIFLKLKQQGVKLVLDIEKNALAISKNLYNDLSLASILFINEQANLTLMKEISRVYINTLVKEGCLIVLTQAERGSTIYSLDETVHIPAYKVDVVDTTGAGDTYNVSFLHAYNQNKPLKEVGLFASAAAAMSIREIGARAGVREEKSVLEFMEKGVMLVNE